MNSVETNNKITSTGYRTRAVIVASVHSSPEPPIHNFTSFFNLIQFDLTNNIIASTGNGTRVVPLHSAIALPILSFQTFLIYFRLNFGETISKFASAGNWTCVVSVSSILSSTEPPILCALFPLHLSVSLFLSQCCINFSFFSFFKGDYCVSIYFSYFP